MFEIIRRRIVEIEREFGIKLLNDRRGATAVALRRCIAIVLKEKGFSLPEIGDVLGRDHTSVLNLLRCKEPLILARYHGRVKEILEGINQIPKTSVVCPNCKARIPRESFF